MKTTIATAAMLGWMLGGCAADVVDGQQEALVAKSELESQVLYIDLARSDRPLTAEQAAGDAFATPVRVVVLDEVAIAFWAPDGVAQENREGFVAAWDVRGHSMDAAGTHVLSRSDELARGEGTVAPPIDRNDAPVVPAFDAPGIEGNYVDPASTLPLVEFPYVLIEWEGVIVDVEDLPTGSHPGCA